MQVTGAPMNSTESQKAEMIQPEAAGAETPVGMCLAGVWRGFLPTTIAKGLLRARYPRWRRL